MPLVLAALAQSGPVLIALDDLPYLDAASAGALPFALRRIGPAGRVRLLGTARGDRSRWAPVDGLADDRVLSLTVGPVTVGALFELLAARLEARLARPVLLRVHATSGGNPLYALELARALARLEIVPRPGVPLPVPTSLDGLVAERVASVPPEILQIAAGAAVSWRFTDAGLDPGAVERAVLAGLVAWTSRRCSGIPGSCGPPTRWWVPPPTPRSATRPARAASALSAGAADPLERARHAALAAVSTDPEVGRALDAGVAAALAGGAPDIAVELSRLALRQRRPTPTGPRGLTSWPTRWSGRATARERWRPSGRRSR